MLRASVPCVLQLYTQDFYRDVVQPKLTSDGIFVTQSGPAGVLSSTEVFTAIHSTLQSVFPAVLPYAQHIPSYNDAWVRSCTLCSSCHSLPCSILAGTPTSDHMLGLHDAMMAAAQAYCTLWSCHCIFSMQIIAPYFSHTSTYSRSSSACLFLLDDVECQTTTGLACCAAHHAL